MREIITGSTAGGKTKEDNPYDPFFKEILPKSLWKIAAVEAEDEDYPYVMVKEVKELAYAGRDIANAYI